MPTIKDFGPQLNALLTELEKRAKSCSTNWRYLDGNCPVPQAITSARMTKAYAALMPMSSAPWASLVVDSVQDRLEVGGIRFGDERLEQKIWRGVWQANALDSESKLGHQGVLTNGRVFATVWPDPVTGEPEVVLDGADQMIVQYQEGRHQARHRVAALRQWKDDADLTNLTLYRRDGVYGFRESKEQSAADDRVQACGRFYEQREMVGADGAPVWPLPNPFKVVPVVEIATNRRLKAGGFPYARGEFAHDLGLLDRINLLTFLGLVVAVWMGFPLRGVIGDKILRDDDDNPLPPFESRPDSVVQFENHEAKVFQLEAADRGNLSILTELAQLAYVTKTPAHYFPMSNGLSNISADAIRALEGGLHAKVDGIHKPFVGEGWEEVMRVGGLMLEEPILVPSQAAIWWLNKESRSLAEQADAAIKLKDILPAAFIAEKYLGLTQEEIGRIEAAAAGSALDTLLREAAAGTNGNGVAPVTG